MFYLAPYGARAAIYLETIAITDRNYIPIISNTQVVSAKQVDQLGDAKVQAKTDIY